jgi:hypothetical protein
MGKVLEIISGSASAPSTTYTALTMASGDSNTVRNFSSGEASLITAWPTGQTTAGFFRIRSPRMHDNVRGITFENPATPIAPPLMSPYLQKLVAQDQLIIELTGSAGAGDLMLASLLMYYDDLPGNDQRLITPEELVSKGMNIMTVYNAITTATGPDYTGAQVINTTNDLFKANTDYALIGYSNDVKCGCIGWRGSDTSNLRVGGPGALISEMEKRDWFIKLSNLTGKPCIPVFNSANKSNTYIDIQQDENAVAVNVTSFFVELGA